ncbi:hypothetical protein NQ314_016409 [Rhamnusium bicolor]|uniref:Reverse transcriptase domain-containing protein n=1 Tax=Rhamnusium bicolor TaxID=1586634 RepID=A0AAV8WVQ2_9CUCU|nr:hypothetical protein NQ314_016409 [Rhamnusium bicolor]
MPNVSGPTSVKRRALNGVVESTLLYGAPVWHNAMNVGKYQQTFERVQRKMLLRFTSAYRTASTMAIQVIAGVIPIEIQVEEKRYLYSKEHRQQTTIKKEARERSLDIWQQNWQAESAKGQWTKRLIGDIRPWIKSKYRRTDYYTTQFLTAHGSFRTYTRKIGKTEDRNCIYCNEKDTVEHTMFYCIRWNNERLRTQNELGIILTPENITEEMLSSQGKWRTIEKMIRDVMQKKEEEERQAQNWKNE